MSPSSVTLIAGTILGLGAAAAQAGPCGDEIARVEEPARESADRPRAGPTAPQSISAQLSRQPTPQSVQRAEAEAQLSLAALLTRAKSLDAEGKAAECMQAVTEAKLKLRVR